jgi:hypothetical protein
MPTKFKNWIDRWWRHVLVLIVILLGLVYWKVEVINHKQNLLLEANAYEIEQIGKDTPNIMLDTVYLKKIDSLKATLRKLK